MAQQITWVAVVGLAVVAAVWDLRVRRVPNVLTFGAAAAGFLLSVVFEGLPGAAHSFFGCLVGLLLFLPLFALGGMGGGDVKLLAAFGAWLGPFGALWAGILASLVGGVMALVIGAARGYLGEAFRNLGAMIGVWRVAGPTRIPSVSLAESRGPRLAYAVPIATGAVLALWLGRV